MMYIAVWIGAHGGRALFTIVHGSTGDAVVLGRSPIVGDAVTLLMIVLLVIMSAYSYRVIEQPWREFVRARVFAAGGRVAGGAQGS